VRSTVAPDPTLSIVGVDAVGEALLPLGQRTSHGLRLTLARKPSHFTGGLLDHSTIRARRLYQTSHDPRRQPGRRPECIDDGVDVARRRHRDERGGRRSAGLVLGDGPAECVLGADAG
jgi:hypothetical protein